MPRPINDVDGDLRELEKRVSQRERVADVHDTRLGMIDNQIQSLDQDRQAGIRKVEDLRRESELAISALEHQVEQLKKDRDKWEQRFWLFVIPLSVMVLGALILAAIGLKKP